MGDTNNLKTELNRFADLVRSGSTLCQFDKSLLATMHQHYLKNLVDFLTRGDGISVGAFVGLTTNYTIDTSDPDPIVAAVCTYFKEKIKNRPLDPVHSCRDDQYIIGVLLDGLASDGHQNASNYGILLDKLISSAVKIMTSEKDGYLISDDVLFLLEKYRPRISIHEFNALTNFVNPLMLKLDFAALLEMGKSMAHLLASLKYNDGTIVCETKSDFLARLNFPPYDSYRSDAENMEENALLYVLTPDMPVFNLRVFMAAGWKDKTCFLTNGVGIFAGVLLAGRTFSKYLQDQSPMSLASLGTSLALVSLGAVYLKYYWNTPAAFTLLLPEPDSQEAVKDN